MKMPMGAVPQRSKVVPSLRVLTEETKLQVPTTRPAIESGGCVPASARDGIAAAAIPMSAMNSRLSMSFPAVYFCCSAFDSGKAEPRRLNRVYAGRAGLVQGNRVGDRT